MGVFGAIKSLFGFKEKKYRQPQLISYFPRVPQQTRPKDDGPGFWEKRRIANKQRLDAERQRRSKYGGF